MCLLYVFFTLLGLAGVCGLVAPWALRKLWRDE